MSDIEFNLDYDTELISTATRSSTRRAVWSDIGSSIVMSHDHKPAPREGLPGDPQRPGLISSEVFQQDKYWWDVKGKMHVIELMDKRYLLNVLLFCYENHRSKFEPRTSPLIQKIRERILADET